MSHLRQKPTADKNETIPMLKLHAPTFLGGGEYDFNTEVQDDEEVVGWVDDLGTIYSSKTHVIIGDLCVSKQGNWAILIMKSKESNHSV